MSFNISTFETKLKSAFQQIIKSQAEALAIEIAANYTAGRTAGEKHQSINTAAQKTAAYDPAACSTAGDYTAGKLTAASQDQPAEEDDGLTTEEKAEIAILVALFLGYLKKFNSHAEAQIMDTVSTMAAEGKPMEEIQQYVSDVFHGKENITIDNTGKKKKELYVDKDLQISEVTKIISKPFSASVLTYSTLLAENVAHRAYEAGRKQAYIAQEFNQWVFVGPADERARPWHVSLLGEIYTWNTEQSNYAEKILQEPRCRHRAMPFYGDETRDVKKEVWQKLKDEVGLYFDEDSSAWAMRG